MPRYASQQDSSHFVSITNNGNVFRDCEPVVDASIKKDAAVPGISPSSSQDTQDTDASSFSRFDKLLDLNPCVLIPAVSSPGRNLSPTAVFKKRKCVECEKCCSKFRKYEVERVTIDSSASLLDEEIEETLGSTTKKVYYHKKCAQIKQYRNDHNQEFTIGLKDLIDRSRAIELEAQQKRMEAIRLEAERKERSRVEEDKNKDKEAESNNKKKKQTKKFLKRVKNTFSSCKGRTGTTDAVVLNGYQEHLDTKTDRMYYSNGVNTTWNKPETYNHYKA